MDLKLTGQRFVVCGASSGFGKAVATGLLNENAYCLLIARRGELLEKEFANQYAGRVEILEADLTNSSSLDKITEQAKSKELHGIVFNAGGPPTGTPLNTKMDQWDEAYKLVMRWKIDLALRLTPLLKEQGYGRILFIESKTVKEPLPALVLSNAFRAGVVGFAKSLAIEVAGNGVTVNVLAPGSHNTPAIERIIRKQSESQKIPADKARKEMEKSVPVGRFGDADELASLALWLLSSHSSYVTGQTISHDGGAIKGIFG
jgi:3-oxoacyl-[acyl-carrier protein] reductase